jgi:hypothetical protein
MDDRGGPSSACFLSVFLLQCPECVLQVFSLQPRIFLIYLSSIRDACLSDERERSTKSSESDRFNA